VASSSGKAADVYEYDSNFYRFLTSFAVRSAEQIVPLLMDILPIRSVADFGCGQGAWLSVWRRAGARVMGIDGPYIDRRHLLIEASEFRAANLNAPIDLGEHFDLVQCVEVAEHLPAEHAGEFIGTLTAHSPLVMFSAAVPGQGGEHHINEQPLEYWRGMFRARDYLALDYIRPKVAGNVSIQQWYRYNVILYVQQAQLASLPEPLRECLVPDNHELGQYWPLTDRVRHALVRQLPRSAVDHISRIKARMIRRGG